jgi:translation initiation factor IF-1
MVREDTIKVEGVVTEILPNRTCRLQLANGHRVLGFMTGKARLNFQRLAAGERVWLELSPYDLSRGRIIFEDQNKLKQ